MMKVEQPFMPVLFLKKANRQECLFHLLFLAIGCTVINQTTGKSQPGRHRHGSQPLKFCGERGKPMKVAQA